MDRPRTALAATTPDPRALAASCGHLRVQVHPDPAGHPSCLFPPET